MSWSVVTRPSLIAGKTESVSRLRRFLYLVNWPDDPEGFYEKCGFIRRGIQMAHYASNLDSSPATAPAPAPSPATQLQTHNSHLALPDLRSTSPLPTGSTTTPHEIELASETQSISSSSGVTYTFPSNALAPAIISPTAISADEGQLQRPAWAEEGLGSNELSPLPVRQGSLSAASVSVTREERPESPLPPGAAPAVIGTEPERSGTQ